MVEPVRLNSPEQGEVKVRLLATAICQSDIHLIRGKVPGTHPLIAGHEGCGIVEEVGDNVDRVCEGDRVVVSIARSCGACRACINGTPHLCASDHVLDTSARRFNQRGDAIWPGLKTAAFAESTVIDQSQVVPIPEEVPAECAALLGCGVITGIGAVLRTAKIEVGSRVAIIGAGGVGLNSIQAARIAGAELILAIDIDDAKLRVAETFGANLSLNARKVDIVHSVHELTESKGVDYVFVTVGNTEAMAQSLNLLRRGGTSVIVGIPPQDARLTYHVTPFVERGQTLIGSNWGSTRLQIDIPQLVNFYLQGRLKLRELITDRFPLRHINRAVTAMEQGQAIRNVIDFQLAP